MVPDPDSRDMGVAERDTDGVPSGRAATVTVHQDREKERREQERGRCARMGPCFRQQPGQQDRMKAIFLPLCAKKQ
jgi:hypothetical protein